MFGLSISALMIISIIVLFSFVIAKVSIHLSGKRIGISRECLSCGFKGEMKNWLGHYNLPQFTSLCLLLCYLIPGLIFIGWAWAKYKCPQCGALAKNVSSPAIDYADAS
jgi:hypothetical protein